MHLRQLKLVLVLAATTALAACEGTMGAKEDDAMAAPDSSETASGTGGDSTGTSAGLGESGGFQGHPLDDPASPLAARTIYFEFDSSDIRASERDTVEAHARYLSEHSGASITLEGHADERGSREYNVALGERRANSVRQLMTLLGASGQQIRTVSYGEERPAATGHDEASWRLNRRVEIIYQVRE